MKPVLPLSVIEPLLQGLDRMVRKVGDFCGEWPRLRQQMYRLSCGEGHEDLVNIPGFAGELVLRYEAVAQRRSIRLVDEVPPDALVMGRAAAIHRVMEDCLREVLDHTPFGGRVIISGGVDSHAVCVEFSGHHHRSDAPAIVHRAIRLSISARVLGEN